MNIKLLIFITGSILLGSLSFAQKTQNVYYLKNNGKHVTEKEHADVIRIIQEPDSGSVYYNLLEYYSDNTQKRVGKVSQYEPHLVFEDTLISYFKNGKKEEVTTYSKGKPVGLRYFYYSNGKLKKSIINDESNIQPDILESKFKLMSYYDSVGVQMIENGNGKYVTLEKDANIIEEGNYVNGLKDGSWKGRYTKINASYEEQYEQGRFISGSSVNDGVSNTYNKPEVLPDFKGGIKSFLEYVGRTYKYPKEAQKQDIDGRVIVSFVVEKDGSLNDLKLLKDLGFGTGEEALRVVRRSPKWIPGQLHGIPVRVVYTLPLSLKMH